MSDLAPSVAPPVAPRRPHRLVAHGDERVDDWYWLRDRDDPEVLAHLAAENAATAAALAPLAARRDRLAEEISTRVPETDMSAPVPWGPWEYFRRTFAGRQYPRVCRRLRAQPDAPEQVLLDGDDRAAGSAYWDLGDLAVSPDHDRLAWSVDTTGDERYTVHVRDLAAGRDLEATVTGASAGLAWASDGSLCFTRPDAELRPFQIWRHVPGRDPAHDELLFEEPDARFFVDVTRARTGAVLLFEAHSKTTSEVRWVPATDPLAHPVAVLERVAGVEYTVEHDLRSAAGGAPGGSRFLVVTNQDAPNGRLVSVPAEPAPAGDAPRGHVLVEHRADARLEGVAAFAGFLVLAERVDGLARLRVLEPDGRERRRIEGPDAAHAAWLDENPEFATDRLRVATSSLVTPPTVTDHDGTTGAATVRKVQEVRDWDPRDYRAHRLWAPAADGMRIPVSLVARQDVPRDGSAPALLYGYGAYETSIDPVFSAARASLLARGVVFAIAHVRGGGEMGRAWYDAGRLEHKATSFTDFVACADHLVDVGWCAPDRLAARGRSAGGLLVGAATNLAPTRFRAVVAEVPFVDVLTTMQDPGIPLTVTEWEEWGDPLHDADAYRAIRSWSPYDNVRPGPVPDMLVTAGLHDARVQYWEPAKWVQRLRAGATAGPGGGPPRILLRTELGAGHAGPSGRYDLWREEAEVLAFVLDALGVDAP